MVRGRRETSLVTASAPPGRLPWIDTARAIGIVLVVFGHALLSVERSGIPADPALIERTVMAIYAFLMPLLFLLAGITHRLVRRPSLGAGVVAQSAGPWRPHLLPALGGLERAQDAVPRGRQHRRRRSTSLEHRCEPRRSTMFWFLYVLIVRVAWLLADATGLASVRLAMIAGPLAVCLVGFPPASSIFSPWLFYWAAFDSGSGWRWAP
jgi:hypothetical protein